MIVLQGSLYILFTIIVFWFMRMIYYKYKFSILNPVVTTTAVIIVVLLGMNINYATYMIGGSWIQEFLGPAVVALAYPLYSQRDTIVRYRFPLVVGLLTGVTAGIVSGLFYVKVADLDFSYSVSFLPKSVTSPIAMDIAHISGGIPSLAAALVIISGVIGAVIGPKLLNFLKITHYLSVGLGLGCAAHGIGTAKAMEYGEKEAACSSISMTLSALLYALVLPTTIHYFL
ncbi:LrgB family protein [Sutcliffiella rhizosphaerae]|uniref:Inner membrane protein YohK n=1 Tax=Sutcliffiella rhizosphaerae TaxID=2880967 RepID=A0ABN8ADI3_9BACI|nr:LrgB family protein [Sutcliffiella rhizosphaerae]CAG9622142.1 Inner membrane protein YohK [Sutcliffiella rhizosphaerae]